MEINSVQKRPHCSMKVGLSAVKAAVLFFDKLLLPQSLKLFTCDEMDGTRDLINELKIIQHENICFSMADLTYRGLFHSKKILLLCENCFVHFTIDFRQRSGSN